MRNPEKIIVAAETGALIVNTWGDLAAQGAGAKMPRPRAIVGTFVFYGLLGLLASFGEGAARFAAASGVVMFLTTLVGNGVRGSGQGGKNLVGLITATTRLMTGDHSSTNGGQ